MTDPSRFPLETSHGIETSHGLETSHGVRPRSAIGERMLVGLALVALIGGVVVGVGNVLNHAPETAEASREASPSMISPSPLPTPSPRPLLTVSVQPGPLPDQQVPTYTFNGWIRAKADLPIHSDPSDQSPTAGILAEGALANADQGDGSTPPDWLHISSPEDGWIDAGPELVTRYEARTVQGSGNVYGLAAGKNGFVALGTPPGPSDRYLPPSPLVSVDGAHWSTVTSTPFSEGWVNSIAWGPAGWLAVGTVNTDTESQVWVWSSSDGREWRPLGQLMAPGIAYVNQVVSSDGGYLIETGGNGGPRGSNGLWFSTDGLTWREAANPSPIGQNGWQRIVSVHSGFYAWTGGYQRVGYGQPAAAAQSGAFSIDGKAWAAVSQGPLSQAMTMTADGRGLLAIDLDVAAGAARVWTGSVDGGRMVWRREPGTDRVFAGGVVAALVSDGQRRYAFGWVQATEEAVVWTDAGTGWTRSALPDSFGGFPRQAVAGPRGVIVLGDRHTLRGDNPIFWHRMPSGEWLPEEQPVFGMVPDPTNADCPALPHDLPEFLVLDRAAAQVCFGTTPITIRAWSVACSQCYGSGPGVSEPAWLMAPTTNQLYLNPIQPTSSGEWSTTAVLAPSVAFEPGSSADLWVELTGHFNDPAAETCRYTPAPEEWSYVSGHLSYVEQCRQTFVVTGVTEVSGP